MGMRPTMPLTRKNARVPGPPDPQLQRNQAGDPAQGARFQDPQALEFVDEVGSLFKNACAQGGKLRAGKIRPATALQRRRAFYRQLDTICARPLMIRKPWHCSTG